jgi:signal transduction histidine kinase/DNA-binding NarL/FixJ family response regulator
MALNDREQIQLQLLEALQKARRYVEYLEAALSHNAAYLGVGIEPEISPDPKLEMGLMPDALLRYLELVEPEEDISDYIGSEGVEHTRPRLGPDAPDSVRPKIRPAVNPLTRLVGMDHPDDALAFPFQPGSVPPGTWFTSQDVHAEADSPASPAAPSASPLPAPLPATQGVAQAPTRSAAPRQAPAAKASPPVAPRTEAAVPAVPATPGGPTPRLLVENVPTPPAHVPGREYTQVTLAGDACAEGQTPGAGKGAHDAATMRGGVALLPRKPGEPRPLTDEDGLRAHYALQSLNVGVWDWNRKSGAIFVSSRWEDFSGKAPRELCHALDILTFGMRADDARQARSGVERLLAGDGDRLEMAARFPTPGGTETTGVLRALARRSEERVTRVTATLQAPDDPAVAAGQPRDWERQETITGRARFFGSLVEGFVLFSRTRSDTGDPGADDYRVVSMNPAFATLYGCAVENAIGMGLEQLTGPDVGQWRQCLQQVFSQGESLLFPLKRARAPHFYEILAFSPLEGYAACLIKEEPETSERVKHDFLANISHELRTPLIGILGVLQVLGQSPLTVEQNECVSSATYSARRLLRIISDILDFSRIRSGRLELAEERFDFSATLRSAMGVFIHEAERKGIRFFLSLNPNIPPDLLGDAARVKQVVFNLVGNALKFTDKGDVRVECEMLPYRKGGKACILVAVSDTGIGIPDDKLELIFQDFIQLDSSSTRRYAGAGLGLAVVKKLTDLMDGSITVQSVPGLGTSVYCTMCFAVPAPSVPLRAAPVVRDKAANLRVLVVEDDAVNRFALRALLKKDGHVPVCVGDGRQAIEALLLRPFDCLITDIQMPVMDGKELALRIRNGQTADIEPDDATRALLGLRPGQDDPRRDIPRDIPIIALTAHALAGDRERFLNAGMDYYLAKPLIAAELKETLARIHPAERSEQAVDEHLHM